MPNDETIAQLEPLSGYWLWRRATQLEGTYPENIGCWGRTCARINRGIGMVRLKDCPDVALKAATDSLPPLPDLDGLAKSLRLPGHQTVRSAIECRWAVGHQHPVSAALAITDDWSANSGEVIDIDDEEHARKLHTVLIDSYDDADETFGFQNWWGPQWGDNGRGRLSYRFFDARLAEALVPVLGQPVFGPSFGIDPEPDVDGEAVFLARCADLFSGLHSLASYFYMVEGYEPVGDIRRGWAIAVRREAHLDVEDLFVMPDYRRRGLARKLAGALQKLAAAEKVPLRLWVPHADGYEDNRSNREHAASLLGLSLAPSPERWASHIGLGGQARQGAPSSPGSPPALPRPASAAAALGAASIPVGERCG
jgi:GNAT superfamily N-acetyltransferase